MNTVMKQLDSKKKPTGEVIKTIFGDVKVIDMAPNLLGGWSIWLVKEPKAKAKKNEPLTPIELPF